MNKLQISFIVFSLGILFSLFFLTKNHKTDFKSPDIVVNNDFTKTIEISKKGLNQSLIDSIDLIEKQISPSNKINSLLKISSIYNSSQEYGISALYFLKAYNKSDSISNFLKGRWIHMQIPKVKNNDIKTYLINETENIYKSILKFDSNNIETSFYYASLLIYEKNSVMPGVQKLLAISRSNPEFKPAQYQLGLLAIRSGQFEKAITRFENLRKDDPESIDILLTLGKAYHLNGDKEKSNELFKRCQSLASEDKKDMVDRYINSIVNV